MPTAQGRKTWRSLFSSARLSTPATALVTVLVILLAASPCAAVRVNVTNCLPDSYQSSIPAPLQWKPLYADAKFDTENGSHNLQLIVWGNVDGSQNRAVLPPPDSDYWRNPNDTNGKIIETPEPDMQKPIATTLYRRVNVLTYEPWHQVVNFCRNGLVNGSCPLSPSFSNLYALPKSTPPF